MADVVALIPVRGLQSGKTRLAGDLSPEARAALTARMLRQVIQAATDAPGADAVVVISPDPDALALARAIDPHIVPLVQASTAPGLNAAITAGRDWALERGAAALVVLFGDLPLLTSDDVQRLVTAPAAVVLASDRHGTGTNALRLRLDGNGAIYSTSFGDESFPRHVAEAERLGLSVATVATPGTAHDLDTPDDWRVLLETAQVRPATAPTDEVVADFTPFRLDHCHSVEAGP